MDKTVLLASFIFPERIEWFISYLDSKFDIKKDKVFCYKNNEDESKVIITFKLTITEGKQLNFKNLFPSAILIHKKGNALYTINALNKLIELEAGDSFGNIDHKSIKIDWDKYQNNLIVINGDDLVFLSISRVF